jgi:hypothetical protein
MDVEVFLRLLLCYSTVHAHAPIQRLVTVVNMMILFEEWTTE